MPEGGADFVHRMESVLDVYQREYNKNHPVICLDESPKQIISETKKSYMGKDGIMHQLSSTWQKRPIKKLKR